jgi:AcrR family transcriptional regulator
VIEARTDAVGTDRRILDVATRLFYEQGYHATTMREVAAGVGIKAGSLYNHYPGKQELLFRIADGTMRELLAGARVALDGLDDPRDRLRAFVEAHVVYHAERRFQARVADEQLHALDPERRAQVLAVRDEYERILRRILEAGCAARGWHVPDATIVTLAVSTMCTAVDVWYREDGRLPPAEIGALCAAFVLRALEGAPVS